MAAILSGSGVSLYRKLYYSTLETSKNPKDSFLYLFKVSSGKLSIF